MGSTLKWLTAIWGANLSRNVDDHRANPPRLKAFGRWAFDEMRFHEFRVMPSLQPWVGQSWGKVFSELKKKRQNKPLTPDDLAHADRELKPVLQWANALAKAYPDATISLRYRNPLELLVATILSAQCTDERVNLVTRDLFRKYRRAEHYARTAQTELEADIRSTGFFRNKARSIRGAARLIVDEFGGRVPATMAELLRLPGVARKTANVVLGSAFGKAEGIVVDTHVGRLSRRLGLTAERDAVKVERDLMALLPPAEWIAFSHRLIQHGRRVCSARKPRCGECVLVDRCPSAEI